MLIALLPTPIGPDAAGGADAVRPTRWSARLRRDALELRRDGSPRPALLVTSAIAREGAPRLDRAPRFVGIHGDVAAIDRGLAEETFTWRADGVEQAWRFRERPSGDGPLEVRVATRGATDTRRDGAGVRFDVDGAAFRYGLATWIDARGTATSIAPDVEQGEIVVRVPEHVLERSAYPAVLDPTISSESFAGAGATGPAPFPQSSPAVAASASGGWMAAWVDARPLFGGVDIVATQGNWGSGGQWFTQNAAVERQPAVAWCAGPVPMPLLVWAQPGASGLDVVGKRYSWFVLDGLGLPLGAAAGDQAAPAVASAGTEFLVVWEDGRSGGPPEIWGARVSSAGVVLDPTGFRIGASTGAGQHEPRVAFDGQNYVVVWTDDRNLASSGEDIYAARVSTAGNVLDVGGAPLTTAPGDQRAPAIAFLGTMSLAVWEDAGGGPSADIVGARLASDGTVLDTAGLPLVTGAANQRAPRIASDLTTGALLTFTDDTHVATTGTDVRGALVALDGNPVGVPFTVCDAAGEQREADVAWTGTGYVTVWTDGREPSPWGDDIRYRLFGPDGAAAGDDAVLSADYAAAVSTAVSSTAAGWLVVNENAAGLDPVLAASRLDPATKIVSSPPLGALAASGRAPAVANVGGNDLLVWQRPASDPSNGSDVYAARFSELDLLDPTGIPVATGAGDQLAPDVAFDGLHALVVWEARTLADGSDIAGARISKKGAVLDPSPIPIALGAADARAPRVAFDGSVYLVVWKETSGATSSIAAALVPPDATVKPLSTALAAALPLDARYAVAAAPTGGFLVAWSDAGGGAMGKDVHVARVATDGTLLDPGDVTLAYAGDQAAPAVAFDGAAWLVAFESPGPSDVDIEALRMAPDGTLLDVKPFAVASGPGDEIAPVARGGSGGVLVAYHRFDAAPFTLGAEQTFVRLISDALATLGVPCATGDQCASGFCVDGVCCDGACGDGAPSDCLACSVAAGAPSDGTCAPLQDGTTCDDGQACTTGDSCGGGECVAGADSCPDHAGDAGDAADAADAASEGGDAGSGDAASEATNAGDDSSGATAGDETGGCGCRSAPVGGVRGAWWAAALLLAATRSRRRATTFHRREHGEERERG